MKKISIINAGTDLGVNVDGSQFGPELLSKDFAEAVSHIYSVKDCQKKETVNLFKQNTNLAEINDFVSEFNRLLLMMHDLHFEKSITSEQVNSYYQKMYDLVLAVKSLDNKNEKRNLLEINDFNSRLYQLVQEIIENGEFPLTIGGDHVIAIGSTLASIRKHQNLGLIWFDAHADFNTYITSVTGNLHGLPLAVATHYEKDILADFHNGPFYNPTNTVIVGGRDIDPWEWINVLDAGVTIFSTEDIRQYGIEEICKKAFAIAGSGTNGVHISYDLDLIDPQIAPGVSVPVKNGINLEEVHALTNEIIKHKNMICSADLVEFNPLKDKNHKTEIIAKDILKSFVENFGSEI